MTRIKKALQKALQKQQDLARVLRYVADLDEQLEQARAELAILTKKQFEEFEDVRKLEKTSLKSLFYKVLGSKEKQIEKERQEYLQVALKYDEAVKRVELLEYERKVLQKKITDAKALEEEIAQLKKQREKELIRSNSLSGQRLVEIEREENQLSAIIHEIEEALRVGEQARQSLHQVISLLRQTNNWGYWGGRRGRGAFNPARFSRYSSIDRAKEAAYHAQQYLRKFEIELADVYQRQNYQLEINLGSFNNFIHMLFDNLISDWIILQKVQNATSNVAAVRDRVVRLLGNLEADSNQAHSQLNRLAQEREELLQM